MNSNYSTKYYFQVFLEDEEETSLFMDSCIYLDHEADEELSYAKEYQSPDQDLADITKKLEDECTLSQSESFSSNSSTEDNQHDFSATVPHFQISDEPKNININKTSRECTLENSASKIVNSVRVPSDKYSTGMCSVKVENFKETPHTHVFKSPSHETLQFNIDPFITSESNYPSKREIKPIFSKIQKKNSSEDMEVVVIDDDKTPIMISDDESPIVISDEDDSDVSGIDVIYVGPHKLSACTAIKDEKPPLNKKIKFKHKEKKYTNVIPTRCASNSDLICEKMRMSQLTNHRLENTLKSLKNSRSDCLDRIKEKKKCFSNDKNMNLEPSKPGTKRKSIHVYDI